ncbi:MAG: tRNA1(Val) (adenine(37)-N6)-methyltransferase [Myxococcota bacterium]
MLHLEPQPGETLDRIAGDWSIFQLRKGHRFSTDDIVCAWRASRARPNAVHLLDLGCGIGSVGIATLWRMTDPKARLVGVEVQDLSFNLARRTVALNGLQDRISLVHSDLRNAHDALARLAPEGGFDLITGSPPYFDVSAGIVPEHPQKAGARFELKGTIDGYCQTAARWLAPQGRLALVMPSADPRLESAPTAHGLTIEERFEVTFREGRPAHIAVVVCRHAHAPGPTERRTGQLTVRDAQGEHTPQYREYQREMGGFGPLASQD